MNTISRIAHRAISSLFSRTVAVKNKGVCEMHSLCSKATPKIIDNKHQSVLTSESLLQSRLPILNQFYGMKYKVSLQLRCKGCYFVTRNEIMYVMCKLKPRHKQSAIVKKEKNTWIWTSMSQSRHREW